MSDLLSERLHEATDRLRTPPRSPASLRRAAEARRRRTRAGAAALTAVAVLATGAAAVLLRGDGRGSPDVPAVSPKPTSAVTLERFLLPSDLPSSGPFTAWQARHDTRDMVGAPTCTTMIKGEPEQSRLVEFSGGAVGTRGYQSVAAYPSIEAATSASLAHALALKACAARLDATTKLTASSRGGDGFQILRRPGQPGETQLTVHARVGRLVSVVWLAAPSDAVLRGQARPVNLLDVTLRRLAARPEPAVSETTPAEEPLAAAMLESTDVTGGSAVYDDVGASAPERNGQLPSVAHPCGRPNPTDDILLKTFSSGPAVLVLQRITVATDVTQAQDFEQALLPRSSDCAISEITLVDRPDGASVSTLYYPAQVELDKRATVHVTVVRVGTVVTEIVLVDRQDDGADQSRFVLPLIETAIERIRATAIPSAS